MNSLTARFVLRTRLSLRNMSTQVPNIIYSSPTPGPLEQEIAAKIQAELNPTYLKIKNDSLKHAHHAGIRGATNVTESHFDLEVVSDLFAGKNMPSRHRIIYLLLDNELKNKGLHALLMKTKTPGEVKL